MLKWKLVLLLILTQLTYGCVYEYERYIYKESQIDTGAKISFIQSGNQLEERPIYEKGEYKFIPNFYYFSRSYSTNVNSYLAVSSKTKKSIYIKKVTIESENGTHLDEILFEKFINLSEYSNDKNINHCHLELFGQKSIDATKYWDEGDIKVKIDYKNSTNESDSLLFEFELLKTMKIAWPST